MRRTHARCLGRETRPSATRGYRRLPTSWVVGSFPACSFFIDGKFTGLGTLTLGAFFSFGTEPSGVIVPIRFRSLPPNLLFEFLFLFDSMMMITGSFASRKRSR